MTDDRLTDDELALIEHLRHIPRSTTRDELTGLVRDLIDFVRDPRCPESQGDGVPCASVEIACEDCRHVIAVLAALHQRLCSALPML